MFRKALQIQKIIAQQYFTRQISKTTIWSTLRVNNFYSNEKDIQESINFNKCRHISSIVKLYCAHQNMSYFELIQMYKKIAQMKDQISTNRFLTPIIKKIFFINYLECPKQLVVLICQLYPNFYDHSAFDDRVSEHIIQRVNLQLQNTNQLLQISDVLSIMTFASFVNNQSLLLNLNQIILKNIDHFRVEQIKKYIQIMRKKQIFRSYEKNIYNSLLQKLEKQIEYLNMDSLIFLYVSTKSVSKLTFKIQNTIALMEERIQQNILNLDFRQIKMLLSFKSHLNIFMRKIFDKIIQNIDEVNNTIQVQKKFNAISLLIQISQFCSLEYLDNQKREKITKFLLQNLKMRRQIIILLNNRFLPIETVSEINSFIINNNIDKYLKYIPYIYTILYINQLDIQNIPNLKNQIKQIANLGFNIPQNKQKFMQMALVLKKVRSSFPQDVQVQEKYNKYLKKIKNFFNQQENISRLTNSEVSQNVIQHFHNQFSPYYLNTYITKYKVNEEEIEFQQFKYFFSTNEYLIINKNSYVNGKQKNILKFKNFMQRICLNPRICTNLYGIFFQFCKDKKILQQCLRQIQQIICNIQVHILLSMNQCIKLFELINQNINKWINTEVVFIQNLLFSLQNSPQFLFKKCKQYPQIFTQAQQNNKLVSDQMTKNLIFYNKMTKQYAQFLLADKSKKDHKNYLLVISGQQPNLLFFKFDTNKLLLVVRSDYLKQSQLQGRLKEIIGLTNKSSHETIELLIMNFSMQISSSSSKILNALIKRYTQFIKSPFAKQLRIQSILFSLTKIPFLDTSEYRSMLNELKQSNLLYYGNTPEYIHFLFIKQCLIYQIEIKNYFNQILKQFLKHNSKRNLYSTNFHQYCELIFTLEPENGKDFLQYMLKQQIKFKHENKVLKQNQFIELSLINTQNKVYMDYVCKIVDYYLSYTFKIIPEWFIIFLSNKSQNFKNLSQKVAKKIIQDFQQRRLPSEIKMFQYLVQLISSSSVKYELIFKNKVQAIKIDKKYIIVTQKYFHPYLDKKLKEIYGSVLKLNQKEEQLIIFYLNPVRCRFDISKFLIQNIKEFKDNQTVKNKTKYLIDL